MLFAYNQQLGSGARVEWWPLALYQAASQLAARLNGIKKSADCEFD